MDAEPDVEVPPLPGEDAGEPKPADDTGGGEAEGARRRKTRSRGRKKSGRGEERREGRGEERKEGRGEERKEGRKEARKDGRKEGRKSEGRNSEGRNSEGRRDGRKSEGRRDGRKSEGRRDGRKSERRRDGRKSEGRYRDPRAIDIVPRAPEPSEAAKEKILLVNATDREEARIALLVDGRLEEIYVEMSGTERSSAGNIYRGRVQNVEPGIGAAFVDLGRGITGFLHVTDLPQREATVEAGTAPPETGADGAPPAEPASDEDAGTPADDGGGSDEGTREETASDEGAREEAAAVEQALGERSEAVDERLQPGDEVIVQITRDSIGRKGPALTGRISFPGRYLVLMPFTDRSGISRRIPQGAERERVRRLLRDVEVPDGMGVIVRTASETTDAAALQADRDHLLREWEFIKRKAAEPGPPGLLRGESDLAERSVRDIMPGDVDRIVVDRDEMAGQIHRLLRVWYPSAAAAADEAAHAAVRTATAALDTPLGELRGAGGRPPPALPAGETPESEDAVRGAAEPAEVQAQEGAPVEARDAEATAGAEPEESGERVADAPQADAAVPAEADEGGAEAVETEAERLERLTRAARAMPEVELHTDPLPLFHRFGVEPQIEDAFRRTIRLPSGGSIVIDPTEALVAVDVNSGRLTGETDPESTALVTNLEAVSEAARQLRLRDLGGLIVIDFIDMRDRSSRRKVETALQEALSHDRARIRMGRMGPFGLVVLSRQRIRQALSRVTHEQCSSCGGTGNRRQLPGLGLRVLREMEARVARSRGRGGLEVRAPQEVIGWIRKHRSAVLRQLGKACSGPVSLEADGRLASDGWAMKGLPPGGGEGAAAPPEA